MSERQMQILQTFEDKIPGLSENDKDALIIFGHGIAEGKRLARKEMEEKIEEKTAV